MATRAPRLLLALLLCAAALPLASPASLQRAPRSLRVLLLSVDDDHEEHATGGHDDEHDDEHDEAHDHEHEIDHEDAAGPRHTLTLDELKAVYMVTIFATAVGGALAPVAFRRAQLGTRTLVYLHGFSGGVFLAAGLTHLLPDAIEAQAAAYASSGIDSDYPAAMVLAIVGMLAVLFVEKVFFHVHSSTVEASPEPPAGAGKYQIMAARAMQLRSSLIVLVALSVHAILAGVALGLETNRSAVTDIFVAVVSHKAVAAMAVGLKLLTQGATMPELACTLGLFSLVTPFGMGVGWALVDSNPWVTFVLDALCAGSFLYVGMVETTAELFEMHADGSKDDSMLPHTGGVSSPGSSPRCTHPHKARQGEVPFRERLTRFLTIIAGIAVISLVRLAYRHDHAHAEEEAHGHKLF